MFGGDIKREELQSHTISNNDWSIMQTELLE